MNANCKKVVLVGCCMLLCFCSRSQSTYWWNDAVFYEVFVRSFYDQDGDGNGDLLGLVEKLDYLNDGDPATHTDLGVTALWLMPIQQSPSYHGYDVIDYRTVEEDYGSNADFKLLMEEAHKRGIKVIIDLVMNHSSSQHPWFTASKDPQSDKRNWYTWNDQKPAITGPWGQQVWHTRSGSNFYGIFWSEMPDLNYENEAVKIEMFDVAKFWLNDMNVDGFRLDAIKYIIEDGSTLEDTPETISFWKDFRDYYKEIDSNAVTVGEAWASTDKVKKYSDGDGLDFCFEFDLAEAMLTTASSGSVAGIKSQLEEVINTYPFLQYGTFLTNHDMNRVMNRLGSEKKAKIAADLLFTLPGIPYVYYGEEIGMRGAKPDENIRTPMQWDQSEHSGFTMGSPWRPANSDYTSKNVFEQRRDTNSLWQHYQQLIALRNNQEALRVGEYEAVNTSSSSVLAFQRVIDDQRIVVVSNPGTSSQLNVELILSLPNVTNGNYVLVDLCNGLQRTVVVKSGAATVMLDKVTVQSTFIFKLLTEDKLKTTIELQVDMSAMILNDDFDPEIDKVDVVAGFNGFGTDSISVLKDLDGDSVYSVVVSDLRIGESINYKYRINAENNGREEYSNSEHLRFYRIQESLNIVRVEYEKEDVLSIKESFLAAVSLFPNPVSDKVHVQFGEGDFQTCSYQLMDAFGVTHLAGSEPLASGQFDLRLSDVPVGIYSLKLTSGNSEISKLITIVR